MFFFVFLPVGFTWNLQLEVVILFFQDRSTWSLTWRTPELWLPIRTTAVAKAVAEATRSGRITSSASSRLPSLRGAGRRPLFSEVHGCLAMEVESGKSKIEATL